MFVIVSVKQYSIVYKNQFLKENRKTNYCLSKKYVEIYSIRTLGFYVLVNNWLFDLLFIHIKNPFLKG